MEIIEVIGRLIEELDTLNYLALKKEDGEWLLKFGRIEIRDRNRDNAFAKMIEELNIAIENKQIEDDNKYFLASVI